MGANFTAGSSFSEGGEGLLTMLDEHFFFSDIIVFIAVFYYCVVYLC